MRQARILHKKAEAFTLLLIRMFWEYGRGELCSPAGDRRSPLRIHIDFGRDVVFSADLCYNDTGDVNGRTEKSQDHSVERCGL